MTMTNTTTTPSFDTEHDHSHSSAYDNDPDHPRTLFVGNIPRDINKREIETIFGELGPLKRCFIQYPRSNASKTETAPTIAYVTYALPQDATSALQKLNNYKLGGNQLSLKFAKSRTEQQREQVVRHKGPRYQGGISNQQNQAKENDNDTNTSTKPKQKQPREKQVKKKARLIVRNLAFQATEEKLSKYFSKYGTIKEINLLKKPNGKLVGCAFLQFGSGNQAAKVIKELNMKPFMGRPIAIDWALPKTKFQETNTNEEIIDISSATNDDVKEEETEETDSKDEIKIKTEPEESEDECFTSSVSFNIGGDKTKKRKKPLDEDDESDNEEHDSDSDSNPDSKPVLKKPKLNPNDADEGRTLFIRNLDFDVTSDQLKEFFGEFGPVNYAVLCKDKLTEHPKGTGFVRFWKPEDVEKCIEKSQEEPEHFILGNRQFYISLAMSKEKLINKLDTAKDEKDKDSKTKIISDKRNLFLVREGFIRPQTPAADGISSSDLNKRAQLYQYKKQMLKDLKIFVSDRRLCIHNLPTSYTDQKLKKLCKKYGGEGAKITEARVMRDLGTVDMDGLGKSKEFGFVTFTEHEHALKALRSLNNNPKIFSVNKRPIVEFSLENLAAIRAKEKRMEKSREKLGVKSPVVKGKQSKSSSTSKKLATPGESIEVEEFAGLTSQPGLSSLPSTKPKGKITRRNLKVNKKKNKQKQQQERRMREPKTRSKKNKGGDDDVDKIVKKYQEKTQGGSNIKIKGKMKKRKTKWFE